MYPVAYPGFQHGGGRGAVAAEEWGVGRGCPLHTEAGYGEGAVPPPQKFF